MSNRTVRVTLELGASGFQAALAKAGASSKQFAGEFASSVQKNDQHIQSLSTGIGVFGAAVGAGVGLAVKSFADFDQKMSNVAATGEDAKNNLNALRDAAIDMGATTVFSAGEAADGIENLLKAGVDAKDVIGGGLKGSLDLAAAGSIGVGEAAEIAATAMVQFKLQGKDVPHIADLLAAGAGKAQGEVTDMAAALNYVGPVAAQMGVSIEETTGTIAEFASQGILGSQAGTSMRGMLLSLTSPSQVAAREMKKLGINVYDAGGNFVGFRGVADQLQSTMKDLTNAERDEAFGRIFGNEQVTAARILYDGGSAAVDKWTAAVNDSGYAAETAATRMDNFKGDLEGLKGAFETALIGLGEGSNGPLRELVQNLTEGVNAFNDLGEGAKGGLLVAATAIGGLALSVGIFGKIITGANAAKVALAGLGISAGAATAAIGGIGLVIGAAAFAYGRYAQAAAESRQRADDFTQALQGQTEAVNSNTRAVAAKQLEDSGALRAAQAYGLSLETVTDAALGNAAAQEVVRAKLAELKKEIDLSASSGTGVGGVTPLTKAYEDLGRGVFGTNDAFNKAIETTRRLNEANGETSTSLAETTAAAIEAAAANPQYSRSLTDVAGAARDASAAQDELVGAYFKAGQAALAASNSDVAYQQAVDNATAAVKENGRTLNKHTEAGQNNILALNGVAGAALRLAEDQKTLDSSGKKSIATIEDGRKAFIASAVQMGKNKTEAKKLADQYFGTPKQVVTKFTAPGAPKATEDAKKVEAAIKDIPAEKQAYVRSEFKRGGIDAANAALNAINGRTATTYVTTVYSSRDTGGGASGTSRKIGLKAAGGPIHGPGTGTSDDVLSWLSNGEYVIREKAAKRLGQQRLDYINRYGDLPRFAAGGIAGGRGGLPGFAAGGVVATRIDEQMILRILAAVTTPLSQISSLTRAVATALAASNRATATAAGPKSTYDRANRAYVSARDRRDDERLENARQLKRAKDRVAEARDDLKDAKSKKGRAAAQRELNAALASQSSISRRNTAEMAELNAKVTATSKAKTTAEAAYKKAADASKAATDKYRAAQEALAAAQEQIADSARQVSDSYIDQYMQGGTLNTLLKTMKAGTAQLTDFNTAIQKLRAAGLNEQVVDTVQSAGTRAGTAMANEILKGGKGIIASLNSTQAALQRQADLIGYNDATAKARGYATGGLLAGAGSGTSDSIAIRASNGEYVVNAHATARNLGLLDMINYGRPVTERRWMPGFRDGGRVTIPQYPGSASDSTVINIGRTGADARELAVILERKKRQSRARAGLTRGG